jgi:pimeloyl-ACP methyl ester carboxylesterase
MTEITAQHRRFRDVHLHVEDTGGDARAVVLIHGWPLSSAAFDDQVPALRAAGYRVVRYDRRGFGRSDKPRKGYDYDTLAEDLHSVLTELNLLETMLVGFSMGGGEVARYLARYGDERVHSAVFAAAVPPYLRQTDDNPDGPLAPALATEMDSALEDDEQAFYERFLTQFFTAEGSLVVSEQQRRAALALAGQADHGAARACMHAFAETDFRADLARVSVPTLVLHGDSDAIVPFEGSGQRTHAAIANSALHLIKGGPHGCNVSHAPEFNAALVNFLETEGRPLDRTIHAVES